MELKKIPVWGKILLVIAAFLTVAAIATDVATVCHDGFSHRIARSILSVVVSLGTVFYAVIAYKKPHGNGLRYTMLLFAALTSICVLFEKSSSDDYVAIAGRICLILACVLVAYMSGRLNKISKNGWLIIVVAVLLLAKIIIYLCTKTGTPSTEAVSLTENVIKTLTKGTPQCLRIARQIIPLAQWFAIASAYMVRFKSHAEAGLRDKGDN